MPGSITSRTTASNLSPDPRSRLMARFAVARDLDGMAFRFQIEAQALRQMRFVFDHQDAAHARLLGNSRVTVVPRPSPALSANTLPPCARAIARTMNKPRPVPFAWPADLRGTR